MRKKEKRFYDRLYLINIKFGFQYLSIKSLSYLERIKAVEIIFHIYHITFHNILINILEIYRYTNNNKNINLINI